MSASGYTPPSSLRLPMSTLKTVTGFSIDFGGSGIKLAYLPKDEWENKSEKAGVSDKEYGELKLISFPRENMEECIEFIKNNCYMKKPDSDEDKPVIPCSGVGAYQYTSTLGEKLNVKMKVDDETQCNQAAFDYLLDHFSMDEICVPVPTELSETVKKNVKERTQMMVDWNKSGATNIDLHPEVMQLFEKQYDPNTNIRPCLMASFGSAWMVIRFGENGSVSMVNYNCFAGRSFLGLGNLLTGAKTYDELMDLAVKGNNLALDVTDAEVTSKADTESKTPGESSDMDEIYGRYAKLSPRPTFLWGKAVATDTSKFKKEDIARSLLYTLCMNMVTTAFDACMMARTRHIFIHGNFVQHPLTQRLVWEEFETRKWQAATFAMPGVEDADYHFHILKHGSHLGAIGALFRGNKIK